MCLAVYVASSLPLPSVPWNEAEPAFYLEPAPDWDAVRKHFPKSFVYYAGSHEGCGCGFSKDGEAGVELVKCQENYVSLAGVLTDALSCGAELEIFTCWEGDQSLAPETFAAVSPRDISAPEYELQQLELVAVRANDANHSVK